VEQNDLNAKNLIISSTKKSIVGVGVFDDVKASDEDVKPFSQSASRR